LKEFKESGALWDGECPPNNNNNLDYFKLNAKSIRVLNRLLNYI